jgi:alkaline phosphatase D
MALRRTSSSISLAITLRGKIMQIAFTSCFSAPTFKDQPVWEQIGQTGATHLVLLGDNAYYDSDGASMGEVKAMGADRFARHAFGRLRAQLQQHQFAKLVGDAKMRVHPIWDDHDFLWNGACGAQVAGQPSLSHLLAPTRAAFRAYRDALDRHDPTAFPAPADSWSADVPEPGYRHVDIGAGTDHVLLHLTDGRSYKTRGGHEALLGREQLQKLEAAMNAAHPETVHLLASGVVFEARHGETWMDCEAEHQALLSLAGKHRILMLSGDVHENRFATPYPAGPWNLFDATSSGAALKTVVTIGTLQCNWGLVDITPDRVVVQLSQLHLKPRTRTIDRATWQLVPVA